MVFGKNGSNFLGNYKGYYWDSTSYTLTIGPGIVVRGSNGTLGDQNDGYRNDTIINQGTIAADDSGGASSFAYDTGFSDRWCWTGSTADAIDTSGVSNPAPAVVYQTWRASPNFSYTLGNLTPGASYTVGLDFAEPSNGVTAAGQRQFNVGINGTQVLTNFDIVATAGGQDKAVRETFTATADANGQITVNFSQGAANYPLVNGIEVLSGSTVVQAINCGLLPGGTITVNPSTFANQGSLQASHGETLNVNNLVGNLNTASVTDAGSSLSVSGTNWVNDQARSAPNGTALSFGGTWTNPSPITANGATVTLNGVWSNSTTIAATNCTLNLGNGSNAWSNTGTITATNSTTNLGGNFTLAALGTFNRVGGAVNLTGTLDLLPVAPTGLWGTQGENWASLRWVDNAVTEAGYKIERSTDGVNFTQIGTVGANVTTYNDMGLSSGATYYYRVRAYSQLGDSPYSTSVSVTPGVLGNGLLVQYFNSHSFSDPAVLTRVDGNVDFDWGSGSPDPRVNVDQFAGRWTGRVQAQYTETYTFDASQDDRVKVWVNGQLVVNHWDSDTANNQLALVAGQKYNIQVDYQEDSGSANVHVDWSSASTPKQAIPAGCLYVPSGVGASLSANIPGPNVTVIGGSTLALDATTGSWNLVGGTIRGGAVSESGGAELVFTSSGGTLDGVTANSDLDLASNNNANVHIVDGLTLNNATVYVGNATGTTYGEMFFDTTEALGGAGTVVFGKNGSNFLGNYKGYYWDSTSYTLTIGPGIVVRGSNGTLGDQNDGYRNDTIINQGTIAADDSGGASSFAYDTGFSDRWCWTGSTADAIDTSGVSNPAPAVVYQTWRASPNFSYALGNLTPGASYTVALDFAEPSNGVTAAGQRQFNVGINGTQVLTNFDIFATAGGQDKAVRETFTATADANGQITINFSQGAANYPLVNGIEVLSGSTVVQAINCGLLPGGTITVNPSTFANQGSLQASHGETLNVNNLVGNLNTASVTDAGSSLSVSGTNWVNDQARSAPNGTALSFGGTWTNPSPITANGATVTLNGVWSNSTTIAATNCTLNLGNGSNAWSNTGTITATNSTTNLGGNFTLAALGTFNRVGGAVNLTGTLDLLPVAPTGLWGTQGENWASLRWADNAVTEAGYKIERSTDGVNFTQIGTVGANVTTYNDMGLSSGDDLLLSGQGLQPTGRLAVFHQCQRDAGSAGQRAVGPVFQQPLLQRPGCADPCGWKR